MLGWDHRFGSLDGPVNRSLALPGTVESVVKTQSNGKLLATVASLWIEDDDLVLDVTYGRGNFWTVYRPQFLTAHDLAVDGVDFRLLPEADESVDVVVFDPPYIAQGGRDTSTLPDFLDAFGLDDCPKSVAELERLIQKGIREARRVLKPGGRLLMKCMDYINGGRYVKGRHFVVGWAEVLGLEQVDEFIHYSGTGPQPARDVQLHSRRAHSILCVFQKPPVRRKSGA